MEFSIKDFYRKLQIWSHLLKKPLMENFILCAVIHTYRISSNKRRVSNKRRPQISAAPFGIHIEITASL